MLTYVCQISAFGYVAIVLIYLWAVFFQFGWGPVCWILVSEIPTARLRALNVAIGAATQWLFNFIIARTVLTMKVTMGTAGYVSATKMLTLCDVGNKAKATLLTVSVRSGHVLPLWHFRLDHGHLRLVLHSRDQGYLSREDGRAVRRHRAGKEGRRSRGRDGYPGGERREEGVRRGWGIPCWWAMRFHRGNAVRLGPDNVVIGHIYPVSGQLLSQCLVI